MYSTPRKQGSNTSYGSPTKKIPLKGLFQDGPRLPASHFLVRKEGPNKGRWFYTCQGPKESGCGFFLWDDDAAGREMSAVINNSRSEPAAILKSPADAARDAPRTPVSQNKSVAGRIVGSNKWMADLTRKDEDDFGDWPLSLDDELKVVDAVDETVGFLPSTSETPRKAIKYDALATPGSKRKRQDAFPTPQTNSGDDRFTSPASRLKGSMWDGNEMTGLRSPSITPTPNRFHDALRDTNQTEDGSADFDITEEVMALLEDQFLDGDISTTLRKVLNKHGLKTLGIAKGRDMTRLALKTKDAKIAELQQRITALETERDMDKVVIRHFKDDMAHSVSKRGGRSRGRGRGS